MVERGTGDTNSVSLLLVSLCLLSLALFFFYRLVLFFFCFSLFFPDSFDPDKSKIIRTGLAAGLRKEDSKTVAGKKEVISKDEWWLAYGTNYSKTVICNGQNYRGVALLRRGRVDASGHFFIVSNHKVFLRRCFSLEFGAFSGMSTKSLL